MSQYKLKSFDREAKKEGLEDKQLNETINWFKELDKKGQDKFSIGSSLYKIRIATKIGIGKSGGSRSIVLIKKGVHVYWFHLYAKNEKENITGKEEKALKRLAKIYGGLSDQQIKQLISVGELVEVNNE